MVAAAAKGRGIGRGNFYINVSGSATECQSGSGQPKSVRTRQLTLTTASEQVDSVTCYKMRKPTSRQTIVELNRGVSVLFVSQAEC